MPKPWITHAHCDKRLAFAAQRKDWGLDVWQKVLQSNEARFEVTDNN